MFEHQCIYIMSMRWCAIPFSRNQLLWQTARYFSSRISNSKISYPHAANVSPEVERKLLPLREAVRDQGTIVRNLKESKASVDDLNKAIVELKSRKQLLQIKELELHPPVQPVDKARLDDLLKQKFFYDQAFAIYGGVQGLYDFGPMGCAVKNNLLREWREFFVLEDHMLELECPALTPEAVLKASGHVDRFTDILVSDVTTGENFRADHLVRRGLEDLLADGGGGGAGLSEQRRKAAIEALCRVESMDEEELKAAICTFDLKSPATGNQLTPPRRFNLMLETSLGGSARAYLRPETAQGIFANFRRLLDFNHGRLPLAAAQVGASYRNEIAPRSGLLRLREFALAEIEHFYDPGCDGGRGADHPGFASVAELALPLLSAAEQAAGASAATWLRLDEAVASGLVGHQTLAYYLGRVHLFLTTRCGLDPRRLRFRQHQRGEMAHYASDCWDAECLIGGAWVECVGCADRAAYDLARHAAASGARLVAERLLAQPTKQLVTEAAVNRPLLAEAFPGDADQVESYLTSLAPPDLESLVARLRADGSAVVRVAGRDRRLLPDMLAARSIERVRHTEEVTPSVVEPSFGVGRIMAAVFEHSFRERGPEDESQQQRRTFLSLPPWLAPYQCSVLPLVAGGSGGSAIAALVRQLSMALTRAKLAHRVDATGAGASIGKRYARTDQLGIPFAVTVDFDSVAEAATDGAGVASVTLRERDSRRQVRVQIDKIPELIQQLVQEKTSWQRVLETNKNVPLQAATQRTASE